MRTGRPRKEIDKTQFENLCGIQCTLEEVCCFFECDEKTLNKWCKEKYGKTFSQVFNEKRGTGRVSLRRSQFQTALKGNASMLIWLGKQYLGQTDNPAASQEQTEVEDLKPLADLLGDDDTDSK